MKRFLSWILSLAMVISLAGVCPVSAAGVGSSAGAVFSASVSSVADDGTFTVTISSDSKIEDIVGLQLELKFDVDKFEMTAEPANATSLAFLNSKMSECNKGGVSEGNCIMMFEDATANGVEIPSGTLYTLTFKVKSGTANGKYPMTLTLVALNDSELESVTATATSTEVTVGTAATPVTSASFTLDSGYAVGEKIVSIKVSGTNTGLVTLGGYGTGYVICKKLSLDDAVLADSTETFAAGTDYYLAIAFKAADGYTLDGLKKENIKLGDKTADDLIVQMGMAGVVFKLDQLAAPTHTHTKGDWVAEVPATCVATGTKGHYLCTGCDKKLDVDGNEIADLTIEKDPNNHTFGTWANEVPATCVATGTKAHKDCTLCGKHFNETGSEIADLTIEKNSDNHASDCKLGAWQWNGTKHWKEWSQCKKVADEAEHTYTEGVCECGAVKGKEDQTISVESTLNFTYGDTDPAINATAKTSLSYSVTSGDAVEVNATTGALTIKKAGTATVTVTAAETTTYTQATKDVTVTVNKKEIEIAGSSAVPRTYEKDNFSVDIGSVGFSGTVGSASLVKDTDYTVTATVTDNNAGTHDYTISVTLMGDADSKYQLKTNSATHTGANIYQADPTAPTGLKGKTGNKLSTVTLPDGWSWVAGDTVMEKGERTYKANYAGSTNYNPATDVELTVNVTDKDIQTITVDEITATYGETGKTINATLTTGDGALSYAVKSGDAVEVNADTGALTFKKAGTATVTVTAKETAAYAEATKDVTVTVNKAKLTVTAKSQSIYVDTTAPDLTAAGAYTVTGLVEGDSLSVTLAYSDTPDTTKAGSYDIIVTAVVDTEKYDLTAVDGKLTIAVRPASGGGSTSYVITVEDAKNGDVKADRKSASSGTTVTVTVAPDKGYTLETLTVLNKNGKEVKLTDKGNGKYTFTMPASKVTVKATFMEDNTMLNFFVDVPADSYYADAVLWAAEKGITGGVDAVHFAPDTVCDRAQAVTFLWRAAGSPAPKSTTMPFTDVKAGSYYYDAVLWAVENGITKGTGDGTTFSPDMECNRAQIVTFLWRSQKSPAVDAANPFADVAADAYYTSAVLWAVKNGVTTGTAANAFSPDMDCTRAQIVTFIYRCMK